jgi:hypothetical protein
MGEELSETPLGDKLILKKPPPSNETMSIIENESTKETVCETNF